MNLGEKWICKHCGTENPEGYSSCEVCEKDAPIPIYSLWDEEDTTSNLDDLLSIYDELTPSPVFSAPSPPSPKKKSGVRAFSITLILIIIIVPVAIGIYTFLAPQQPDNDIQNFHEPTIPSATSAHLAVDSETISSFTYHFSDERVDFGDWWTYPIVFDQPIYNCTGFMLDFTITSIEPASLRDTLLSTKFLIMIEIRVDNQPQWKEFGVFLPNSIDVLNRLDCNFSNPNLSFPNVATIYRVAVFPNESFPDENNIRYTVDMEIHDIQTY